MQGIVSYDQH